MNDQIYERIRRRYLEVYAVAPNDLRFSFLTNLFRMSTSPLKSFPFKVLMPVSLVGVVLMYIVLGILTVRLVSILQSGF